MLQGTPPFKGTSFSDLHALILECKLKYPHPISDSARQLIEALLVVEPEKRISIPEILRHPFLKQCLLDELDGSEDDDDCKNDEHDF